MSKRQGNRIRRAIALASLVATASASAGLRTVAEIGDPAVGFPADFIYWEVKNPVIGASGHIAFTGAADTSVFATANNTPAVWTGRPGQLYTVIRDGESPEGFPASVVFDFAFDNKMVVTDKGSVGFEALMKGSAAGRAFLAYVDGTTHGIIQVGQPAPGYAPGVNVTSLQGFAFTDAGMVIRGTAGGLGALWFWDKNSMQLLVATGQTLSPWYPDCNVSSISNAATSMSMNQKGHAVFSLALTDAVQDAGCPGPAVYRWNAGNLTRVVTRDDAVPGMPEGTVFNTVGSSVNDVSINDNNDVTFFAQVRNQGLNETRSGLWQARANGSLRPIVFDGEAVPGRPAELLNMASTTGRSNASRRSTLHAFTSTGAQVVLAGKTKAPATYDTFDDLATSHLDVVAHEDDIPTGFGATWYRDSIDDPIINNRQTIAHWGDARDALDPFFSSTFGIWLHDPVRGETLLVAEDRPTRIDGTDQTLSLVRPVTLSNLGSTEESTNSGRPSQISDNGQLVFMGAKTGGFADTIFITEACSPETMNRDHGGDCKGDVLMRHAVTNELRFWQMDGPVRKGGKIDVLGPGWTVFAVGDLTGDAKADIVLHNLSTGELRLWEMNGTKYTESVIGPLNSNWNLRGVGDTNGDGRADLVFRHKNNGRVRIWEMKGNKATVINLTTMSSNNKIVAVADFDANGTADLLFRNKNGSVRIWRTGRQFPWATIGPLPLKWEILAVADVGGDGKADIILRNNTNARLRLWEIDAGKLIPNAGCSCIAPIVSNLGRLNPKWEVVQATDFNDDDNADLLLRNSQNGSVRMWTMDGSSVTENNVSGLNLNWQIL